MFWIMFVAVLLSIVIVSELQKKEETERQEKKTASINELKEADQNVLLKTKEELLNNMKGSFKPKAYPIMFRGRGNAVLGYKLIMGVITEDICCVVSEDGRVIDYYFPPYLLAAPFAVVKEKEKQRNTVKMNVQEAARIGNGLGGIGAGASAAANAMKINSEGGLRVTHNVTAHHLFFIAEANMAKYSSTVLLDPVLTTKAMVEIRSLWIDGKEVNVPSYKKTVTELCDKLNNKMNSISSKA